MSIQEDLRRTTAEDRTRKRRLVQVAEEARTPRDHEYAKRIDALISRAEAIAHDAVGIRPQKSELARRVAWDQAWSREFHRAMDNLAFGRGYRTQSHQAGQELN